MRSSIQQNDDKNQIENKLKIVKYGRFIYLNFPSVRQQIVRHKVPYTSSIRYTQKLYIECNKSKQNHSSSSWIVNCSSQTENQVNTKLLFHVQFLLI